MPTPSHPRAIGNEPRRRPAFHGTAIRSGRYLLGSVGEPLASKMARLARQCANGCIEWAGDINGQGYGRVFIPELGKLKQAHRISYEMAKGEIPDGLVIDHLCRNRKCINPEHLEVVTSGVNTLRGRSPSANNARKTNCKRGHPFDEENTYLYKGFRHCRRCRHEWKVNRQKKIEVPNAC